VKRTSRHRCVGAAVIIFFGIQAATAGSGGSTYSLLGLGDIRYAPGARSEGMGVTGLALFSSRYVYALSPATWSRLDRVRVEGSAFYEGLNSTDGITSRYLARMDFSGALLAIPVSRASGVVVVASFTPYSDVNYDTYTSTVVPSQGVDPITGQPDSLGYLSHQSGTGGITRGQVGLSWAPSEQFSFGASFSYLFGTINHILDQIPQTPGTTGGTFTDKTVATGVNFTGGMVISNLEKISGALPPLSLGFVITTRTNLHTKMETTYDYAPPPDAIQSHDTTAETYGRVGIPFSYGIGLGFKPSDRWTLAADYVAQPWSHADYNGVSPYGIRDSYRLGIGAELAASTELNSRWFEKFDYRFGVTYAATYYAVNGQNINEWDVTGGIALPITGESRLNFAASYGGRGTTAGGLVKDRIFRLVVSFHISDVLPWFVQTQEE